MTYGSVGGYTSDPSATISKLSFKLDWQQPHYKVTDATGLAMLSDGSFWVVDTGNGRILHIDNQRNYVEQVAYRPASYSAAVDPNNPSRVFSNFLEYQVDTTHPLYPGLGNSWTLARNWRDSLPTTTGVTGSSAGPPPRPWRPSTPA